jgi:predicted transcriptional regulator
MDHLTIPIPEGLPEDRKADLAGWLTDLARQATAGPASFEDDPQVRAEIVRRIRAGRADADAGRVCDSTTAMRRLADATGLASPA